jgi:release factor glutamine methyltransferase
MTSTLRTLAFGPLTITWHDGVLEPRPWTAAQSRWAAELAADLPEGPALELCSGAGHIGLLAAHLARRPLVCVDIDPEACALTRSNADAAGLGDLVEVREGPMDQVLRPDERFPLVIADPPWVRSESVSTFPEDPVLAIDGGDDGLAVARLCLEVAAAHLEEGGLLVLQLGDEAQAEALAAQESALTLREVRQEERGALALWQRA